jgi:hypothetical protein
LARGNPPRTQRRRQAAAHGLAEDAERRQRFEREARTISSLNHSPSPPNLRLSAAPGNVVVLIGAGVGAVAFALVGNVGCTSDCDEGQGSLLALGAGMGAAYVAGIGALIKTDRWGDVPLEHVRVALVPTRGRGAQLSVTLAF